MSKITLAINPFAPSKNALDFAAFLSRLTDSPLTAAVLENRALIEQQGEAAADEPDPPDEIVAQTIKWFREGAISRDINYKMHRKQGTPFNELIMESRFADVLVIHPAISFSPKAEGSFTRLARNILKRAECPVFVVSESVESVDEIIFANDGSASGMFALKLFMYLFPMLSRTPLTVLHVENNTPAKDPSQYFFKEWIKMNHHGPVDYRVLKGNIDQQLIDQLHGRKNAVLVMGAYKRSSGIRFRSRSYAEWVTRNISIPVFVTHR